MGALTDTRKRFFDLFSSSSTSPPSKKLKTSSPPSIPQPTAMIPPSPPPPLKRVSDLSPSDPSSKKLRLSSPPSVPQVTASADRFPPSNPLRRAAHCPQRILKVFGIGSKNSAPERSDSMRNLVSQFIDRRRSGSGCGSLVGGESDKGLGLEEYRRLVVEVEDEVRSPEVELPTVREEEEGEVRLPVVESSPVKEEEEVSVGYKELYENCQRKYESNLSNLAFEVKLAEKRLCGIRLADEGYKKKQQPKVDLHQPFTPLTDEEENDVHRALKGSKRHEILVTHEASNIEITRELLQCLSGSAWLNDEVINLYLELLKEREKREPKRFLKCHFFNTFFYKRLISGGHGYDFKAVRRWTTQRKIGYSLVECDKIFVPIHKEVHWCLAIINVKEKKFQYLDSLGGMDKTVLRVLVKYLMDEVENKSDKQIEAMSWKQEPIKNLPLQENGYDCGMFMLKYIDFYSRGLNLTFGQEHMPYFRKRTAKEILRLRAD